MKQKRTPLRNTRRSLTVLCVVLAGAAVYELVRPHHIPQLVRQAGRASQDVTALLPQREGDVPPLETFVEIIERPLFTENRRPYVAPAPAVIREPEPVVAPVEPDITEQISLRATIIIGKKRIALIRELAIGKQRRLNQGEAYNGWTLTHVETDGISMQKGEEVRQIELKKGQS